MKSAPQSSSSTTRSCCGSTISWPSGETASASTSGSTWSAGRRGRPLRPREEGRPSGTVPAEHSGPAPRRRPRIKMFNWQVGYRLGTTSTGDPGHRGHVARRAAGRGRGHGLHGPGGRAPDDDPGEHLDVFSLGAIAYHVFSGVPPANRLELCEQARETRGLRISSVLNGAGKTCKTSCSSARILTWPAALTRRPISWATSTASRRS